MGAGENSKNENDAMARGKRRDHERDCSGPTKMNRECESKVRMVPGVKLEYWQLTIAILLPIWYDRRPDSTLF